MSSTLAIEQFRNLAKGGYLIYTWPQGPKVGPNFHSPESTFIFGSTDTGKSRLLIRIGIKFHNEANAQIIDAFGAENDSESTVWLLNPKTRDKTVMITGDDVQVEGWDLKIPISDFTLEKAKDYDVVITDRALFGPFDDKKWDYRYYAALAKIFELAKRREGQRRLVALLIREAWNVIYSQMKAGISRDEQMAQNEFRKMHNQRHHANVAVVIDTQRYTDLAASVRTLTDYRYIKGFGSQPVPNELHFLYKPHLFSRFNGREWMMRNTPLNQFIVLTKKNGVGIGWYADIPWHINKSHSPLKQLGITVSLKQKEADEERKANDEWQGAVYVPSQNDQHRRMAELKREGYGYKDIAKKFTDEGVVMTWQKVAYHMQKKCACEASVSGAAASTNS